jgi:lysozyme
VKRGQNGSKRRRPKAKAVSRASKSKVNSPKAKSQKPGALGMTVEAAPALQWTEGMDVSKNQDVDWPNIDTNAIKFAIIKATDGIDYVDPSFQVNWSAAGQLSSMKRGAYHFFRPDDDVDAQANLIKRTVSLKPDDLPMMLDVENTDNRPLTPQDVPLLAKMLQSLTALFGRKPVVYTGNDSWANLGSPTSSGGVSFGDFPLWIAHYTTNPSPNYPAPWIQWLIWQYTEKGSVAGVTKPSSGGPVSVDLDRFNGSLDGLMRLVRT